MVLVGRVWPDFHGRLGLPGENLETLCSSGEDQASGEDQPTLREYRLFQKKVAVNYWTCVPHSVVDSRRGC